jgi:alginate O-acetyltransferase complex protein AlgI
LLFYVWGEPIWITALLFSTAVNYFIALAAEKYRGNWKGKAAVAVSIAENLLLLGFFKYSGFIADNINALLGTSLEVVSLGLPIGISFYSFKIISYVVDVYKGEIEAQRSPYKLLLYVSLFHQLTAGPIVRYKDIADQIDHRTETVQDFNYGVGRFIIGLGKKVILAGTAGKIAESFMGTDYTRLPVLGAWFGITLFAFQLYFDFSGYSDMAIGLGRMFGFTYKENFNYPYISKSATEFWRRWHISLSSFFRDYVYIPLGGNRRLKVRNLLVVWLLTGLWHGASWNFILWGLYYFVLLFIEKLFLNKVFEKIPAVFARIYLCVAVLVGWVFFYHTDLSQAIQFVGIMFGLGNASLTSPELSIHFWNNAVYMVIAFIGCTPLFSWLFEKIKAHAGEGKTALVMDKIVKPVFSLFVLILSIIFLVGQSYSPFLYFKF